MIELWLVRGGPGRLRTPQSVKNVRAPNEEEPMELTFDVPPTNGGMILKEPK
jgi:hypothetical protein